MTSQLPDQQSIRPEIRELISDLRRGEYVVVKSGGDVVTTWAVKLQAFADAEREAGVAAEKGREIIAGLLTRLKEKYNL